MSPSRSRGSRQAAYWRTWWTGREGIRRPGLSRTQALVLGVVPAKAGIHNHRVGFGEVRSSVLRPTIIDRFRGMGPGLRRDDTAISVGSQASQPPSHLPPFTLS